MTKGQKSAWIVSGLTLFTISILLFRTIEVGRQDAKPALLENLNPAGEMTGPEGIDFDKRGDLYIGDSKGFIWKIEIGGTPQVIADLGQIHLQPGSPEPSGTIHSGGIAIDPQGNLYVAAFDYAGGSVLRVDAITHRVSFFARDIGVANYALISGDAGHIWVSDYRSHGRVLRYPIGPSFPVQPDLIIEGLDSPNGLAPGKDDRALYVAETYSGDIVRIDLTATPPGLARIANLKSAFAVGSLDGLAFDPRDTGRRFLYVAQNLRGIITVLDLDAQPARIAKQILLAQMGGRPCPASMVIRDGYLYFTDLWSCNPIRLLLRMPRYREHAFRFQVTDLSSVY